MHGRAVATILLIAIALVGACRDRDREPRSDSPATSATTTAAATAAPTRSADAGVSAEPTTDRLVLLAGGDVSFGRSRGQQLLRDPSRNDFATLEPLWKTADIRFVNLECPISDQDGRTESPINKLVFTAPPEAAAALARAHIDIVSLANNHAWDYGRDALFETFDRLRTAGVAYVGAGRTKNDAYAPTLIRRGDFTVAFVAVTDVWNQELVPHPGREHIADAGREGLTRAVRKAKSTAGVDKVVVSYHGGYEYVDQPHEGTRELVAAAVEAGADAVIGHHPHVIQRMAFVNGVPVFFSLGNLLMRMANGQPWTEFGALARLELRRGGPTRVAICPVRIDGYQPVPLAADAQRERVEALLRIKLEKLLRDGALIERSSAATLGAFGDDGCAPLTGAEG